MCLVEWTTSKLRHLDIEYWRLLASRYQRTLWIYCMVTRQIEIERENIIIVRLQLRTFGWVGEFSDLEGWEKREERSSPHVPPRGVCTLIVYWQYYYEYLILYDIGPTIYIWYSVGHFTLDYYYEPSILAIFDTIILGPTLVHIE